MLRICVRRCFHVDFLNIKYMRSQRDPKRAAKRAPRRPLRRRGGLRTKGKGSRVNDIAAVSETFMFSEMGLNTIYADYGCSLFQHERARTVAQGYQEFRIKLVEYRFKPLSDTYAPQVGGAPVPYLYYLVDKLRSNNGLQTVDAFTQAGAKAIRFDDKTITVKYKPAVLLDSWDAQSLQAVPRQYRVSPWLTTNDFNTVGAGFNPSSVDHNGLRWVIAGDGTFTYKCERVVHIEFRKPMWIESPGQGETINVVQVDTLIVPKLKPLAQIPDVSGNV